MARNKHLSNEELDQQRFRNLVRYKLYATDEEVDQTASVFWLVIVVFVVICVLA